MTTKVIPPEILAFAAEVRAQLSDLTPEELEELTGGLEADLTESFAEDLRRELPDASSYAAELRAAAGLPRRQRTGAGLDEMLRRLRQDIAGTVRENRRMAEVLEFLLTLRPAWWLARAWVATWLLSAFWGGEFNYWPGPEWFLVLSVFSMVSVQWGRGAWGAHELRYLIGAGNLVAIVLIVPVLSLAGQVDDYADEPDDYAATQSEDEADSNGITLQGKTVTNIFAYDAKGRPLSGVQLFDQKGTRLTPQLSAVRDECLDDDCTIDSKGRSAAAAKLETGEEVGNVFPLSFLRRSVSEMGEVGEPKGPARGEKPPFVKVPALESAKR